MKNFLKTSLFVILIQSLLIGQTFAFSRVDSVIEEDRDQMITQLTTKYTEALNQNRELESLEKHLKLTKTGQSIYLKFETIAGAIIVVGIVIGSYKARFPAGFRAMIGAYISVTGISRGFIKLSEKEVVVLLAKIIVLKKDITKVRGNLADQISAQCELVQMHPICSDI
ncbi:MAG: hypothetical protein H7177_03660 [Rhizobacter sp.]|nr:hypothetical protein [Bacteriovorax sp.]